MTSEQWWRRASIYQVYPRSFADSDGDGIGDLRGVIEHLDHLVDLGVDAVWLSPFFDSPQCDIGYDVRDYRSVAPEYGSLDDVDELIERAHGLGLKVLFDLVLNHTSDQHPWFVESRSSRDNDRADWYVWADGRRDRLGRNRPPNNWRSELQIPGAWQWCEERQQWFLATFLPFQPDLNWHNPAVRAEMFDTVRMWLGRGVDGFRLDIFGSIMHDVELRDNPRRPLVTGGIPRLQTPLHTLNTQENFALATDLRAVADEFGDDRVLLGEVFGTPAELRSYTVHDGRRGLDLVFLFDFLAAPYRAGRLRSLIESFEREFPDPLSPVYVLENHDRTRSMSRLGGDEAKARVMATLITTLRGVCVIYQGQEIGMTNRYIPLREADDPIPAQVARWLPEVVSRRLPERLNRDEVRVPMQWSGQPGAGFCPPTATPWLPIHDDHVAVNVADQRDDPTSLMAWYRTLLALRSSSEALRSGGLRLLPSAHGTIAYERAHGDERMTVVANLTDDTVGFTTDHSATAVAASDRDVVVDDGVVTLPPHTAVVCRTSTER